MCRLFAERRSRGEENIHFARKVLGQKTILNRIITNYGVSRLMCPVRPFRTPDLKSRPTDLRDLWNALHMDHTVSWMVKRTYTTLTHKIWEHANRLNLRVALLVRQKISRLELNIHNRRYLSQNHVQVMVAQHEKEPAGCHNQSERVCVYTRKKCEVWPIGSGTSHPESECRLNS